MQCVAEINGKMMRAEVLKTNKATVLCRFHPPLALVQRAAEKGIELKPITILRHIRKHKVRFLNMGF